MSIIPQTTDNENGVSDFATKFMKRFYLGRLLFKCNAGKEKGVPVMDIFRYLFCMMFSDRSTYMQMKTGIYEENFSKNTIYRFLNNARINWQRFTTLLSASIICSFMKPLTDEKRKDVFIIDDSLFDRSRSKKVELLARVFDHCSMKYRSGFRLLTLGWSDGNSFVPVSYSLLSAAEEKNLLCGARHHDGRSRYLLSVSVDVEKDGESIPVKLVYVRSKGNRKDYLVLISTDTQLSEEEIIRI